MPIGRRRRHKFLNTKNCPALKRFKLVHGYAVKKRKTADKGKK